MPQNALHTAETSSDDMSSDFSALNCLMVQEMNVLTTIESQHVDFHVSWMVLDTTVHMDMSSLEEEPKMAQIDHITSVDDLWVLVVHNIWIYYQ